MAANRYVPLPVPQAEKGLLPWLRREMARLAAVLNGPMVVDTWNVAPDKPPEGMLAIADGTNWNPGSGYGLYIYKSGTWTFIV